MAGEKVLVSIAMPAMAIFGSFVVSVNKFPGEAITTKKEKQQVAKRRSFFNFKIFKDDKYFFWQAVAEMVLKN